MNHQHISGTIFVRTWRAAPKKHKGRLDLLDCLVTFATFTSPYVDAGKTEETSFVRTLLKLAALLSAPLSALEKLTALSTCRLPSYQRVRVHAVAPFAFASTAFLKSSCCDAWKVATDKDGREAEKVTAQQRTTGDICCNFVPGAAQCKDEGIACLPATTDAFAAALGEGGGGGGGGLLAATVGLGVAGTAGVHLLLMHVEPLTAQSVGKET